MKVYIFKLNGNTITLDELKDILQYEVDWCDLFALGKIDYDDVSGENTSDIISVEELEEHTLDDAIKVVKDELKRLNSLTDIDITFETYHKKYDEAYLIYTALKGLKEGKE